MAAASQHVRKYASPGEQATSPGTADDESSWDSVHRFHSLDGFRDSIPKHRELKKVVSPHADTRLEPGQIRLIYFKHSKRSWSSQRTMNCSRYIFNVDNGPPCKALSYTCGPPYREIRTVDGISTLQEPVEQLSEDKLRFDAMPDGLQSTHISVTPYSSYAII